MRPAYAVRQPVVNTFLVRERDRRRVRELGLVLVAVLPLAAALLAYTWIHLEVLRIGYRIDGLERDHHRLVTDERHRRLEASYLRRPERIEERATRELGLQPARVEQLVFLEEVR
jgi:hypothetical protein